MGNISKKQNQILLLELIPIYMPPGYHYSTVDWLFYPIAHSKKYGGKSLTIHHVTKAANGGPLCIENAALLTKNAHQDLHTCEARDHILYEEINDFFREIISYRKPPEDYLMKEAKEYNYLLKRAIYPNRYK